MRQPAQPIETNAFYELLREGSADGVYLIAIEGGTLPVSVRLRSSSTLVFTFSGAVDRVRYALPRFGSVALADRISSSVIAVADPSLERSDDLTLAWYAGHDGLPAQALLPGIFQQMIDSLGATRTAFVGSSGGGFAALYYAWQSPGSVAVVSNPQTILDNYFRAHRRRYAAACWPDTPEDTPLSELVDANLGKLYASRCESSVVYLQVANDTFHMRRHFAPFMSDLTRKHEDRLVVRMDSWGLRGHRPAPALVWIPWLNAALTAPDISAPSIEQAWETANNSQSARPTASSQNPAALRDEQIASELARAAAEALMTRQSVGDVPT